jgi:trehalose 6-phosphate phosphatase
VQVSDTLLRSLARLHGLSGGAIALVSGRRIGDLDRLFSPLALPSIGGHGAEMRVSDGELFYWAKPLPTDLRRKLADAAGIGSGIVVEDKDYSLALHYRKAPEYAEQLRRHIAAARTAFPAEPTELLLGKAMFEVKRPGISKGESIRKLMAHAPFSGRMPVFIGDDVTDESYSRSCPKSAEKVLAFPDISPGSPESSRIRPRYAARWIRWPQMGGRAHDRLWARSCCHREWPHRCFARTVVADRVVVSAAL